MYWIAVYPTVEDNEKTPHFYWQTISEHGVMFIFCWIDNLFNDIKFYKRHIIFLLSFMITYLSLNVYITLNYEPIYKAIDW